MLNLLGGAWAGSFMPGVNLVSDALVSSIELS